MTISRLKLADDIKNIDSILYLLNLLDMMYPDELQRDKTELIALFGVVTGLDKDDCVNLYEFVMKNTIDRIETDEEGNKQTTRH